VNLELPFGLADDSELDAYLSEIDRALDACFLADVEEALETARAAQQLPPDAAVA
jgi:hypothetical protein